MRTAEQIIDGKYKYVEGHGWIISKHACIEAMEEYAKQQTECSEVCELCNEKMKHVPDSQNWLCPNCGHLL